MRQHGFMFTDALIGLLLLGAATAMLVSAIAGSNRARSAIDRNRVAMRVASEALLSMQTRTATELSPGMTIRDLDTPAPKGWKWVSVIVAQDRGRAELVGLVPGGQP